MTSIGLGLRPRTEVGERRSEVGGAPSTSVLRNLLSAIGGLAAKAGPLAEREGDSETGESASLLVRESDSEAPAWLGKRSPADYPCPSE
jgi:hypothetical protein